jgi:chromosome partitioning protein
MLGYLAFCPEILHKMQRIIGIRLLPDLRPRRRFNMICIAIYFPKGGSGKSTTTWALAHSLSSKFNVLVIDMDSQATVTNSLTEDLPPLSSYSLVKKQASLHEVAVPINNRLRLVAGTPELTALEVETASDFERPYILQDTIRGAADVTLIDCPPSTGVQTLASLVAATHVLTPVATEPNCWEQLGSFERLYEQVKRRLNPTLEWVGVLPTRYDSRNILDREVLLSLRDRFKKSLFEPIRATVRLREAMAQKLPAENVDYQYFTNELLRRISNEQISKKTRI